MPEITDLSLRQNGPPKNHDNSMIMSFANCRRKMYWNLRGLDFKIRPSYFTWGTAWQEALGVWYTTKGATEYRGSKAYEMAERFWLDSGSVESYNDTLDNLRVLLTMYAVEYPEEPWEVIAPHGEMELGFELPFEHGYFLCGAIDGYISWKPYGLLILENKSTGLGLVGMTGDKYLAGWGFSSQVDQYIWALRQILEVEPFGALMNIVSKKMTQKAKKDLYENGSLPEGQFARNLEKRSEFRMQEFETRVRAYLEDLETEWKRWTWAKTTTTVECVGGIGKSPCPYQRICKMEVPFDKLEGQEILGHDLMWREEPWEPWKRGKRKETKVNETESNG